VLNDGNAKLLLKLAFAPKKQKLNSGPCDGRYCFLPDEEEVTGFGCRTENCDRLPAGFAFACFGFFFSRLLLS